MSSFLLPGCAKLLPCVRRFGTENEKLGYNVATTQRLTYDEIKLLLEGLVRRFGWAPMMEGDLIIGCELDGQSVTLEPGGQFELSGAPVDTLHKTCAEVNQHLYQARPWVELNLRVFLFERMMSGGQFELSGVPTRC